MKDTLKKNRVLFLYLVLIFLISATATFSNLGWYKPFIGDDYGVTYHFPDRMIKFYYYMWDGFFAPGKIAVTNTFGFLWGNFIFGLFKLGLNPTLIERVVYLLFFLISGIGSFLLLSILMKRYLNIANKDILYLGAFTGSLLYMFNHFTMYMGSIPVGPYHISYMLLPLILVLFTINLQTETSFFSIFLFSIIFLFLLNGNPANTLSVIFFLIAYLLFFIPQTKESHARPILFLAVSFILVLLFCSYIYLPIIISGMGFDIYGKYALTQDFVASFGFNSIRTSFLNLFRLAGLNVWPNYQYYHLYTGSGLFIFLGYLISVFAIVSFLIPDGKKIKIFFGLVVVIALFLAKGVHSPFEKLFLFLVSKIPYFGMYRAVYFKFTFFIVLSYSVLIGFFTYQISCLLKNHRSREIRNIALLVPFTILLYNKPFFTKDIVSESFLTTVPGEYSQLAEVVKRDPSDFKIVSVPPQPGGRGLLLRWNNKNISLGAHPDMFLLNNPVLDSYWFIAYELIDGNSWDDIEFENNVDSLLNYTKLLNTKYIFLHKDFVEKYDFKFGGGLKVLRGNLKAKIIEPILEREKGIEITKDSRYYVLYELSDDYFLPHIYPAAASTFADGDIDMLVPMVETKYLDRKSVLLFAEQSDSPQPIVPDLQIGNFVLKDLNWRDLTVAFVAQSTVYGPQSIVKIEKEGIYEIYLDVSEVEEKISEFDIKIVGRGIQQVSGYPAIRLSGYPERKEKGQKYMKVGEVELEEGEHKIEVHSSWFIAHSKDEEIKLILVNREEREKAEKEIWEKINSPETGVAYIFSQDGEFYVP